MAGSNEAHSGAAAQARLALLFGGVNDRNPSLPALPRVALFVFADGEPPLLFGGVNGRNPSLLPRLAFVLLFAGRLFAAGEDTRASFGDIAGA